MNFFNVLVLQKYLLYPQETPNPHSLAGVWTSLLKCALLYEVNQTQSHFGMHIYGLLTKRGVIHKHAKKEQDQYPAILTEEAW